ncbi:MAG: penicillin-binding protein activator [Halioglobus sp.]
MRQHSPTLQRRLRTIGLTLLAIGLSGCGGTPQQTDTSTATAPTTQQPQVSTGTTLTLPHSEYSEQFSSAAQSLATFDWMTASVTLQQIPPAQDPTVALNQDDRVYLGYLQARIAYSRGYQDQALKQLQQLIYPGMNNALQYRILNFQRHILEMSGDNLASARMSEQILRWAPAESAAALRRSIWRDLQRLDDSQLRTAINTTTDLQWWAWLELARISRENPVAAANQLVQWRSNNPNHPAASPLPGGLDHLLQAAPPMNKVALILPLSGRLAPAGKAVRDGYLAAYYAERAAGQAGFEVMIVDLNGYESANAAYDEAVLNGANLAIGPLSKQAVSELATRLDRPIPVLALNRIDEVLPATGSALVQMSLAPEDEAARIAEIAFGRGARRALIVRPAGDWGTKVEAALQARWAALGGSVATSSTYASRDDYSSSVKNALDLPASEKRGRDVRSMLATNIEFTARRRQDADVVFLLSRNGPEARSIKPLLAFHYASNLPVYAISSIYNGTPDSRDKDLSDINFVETPWLLGGNPGLRVTIAAGDTGSDNYTRLNALGADAFLLQSNFTLLQAGPDVLLKGNTGLLSMNSQLQIQRELSLATFDGSVLTPQ